MLYRLSARKAEMVPGALLQRFPGSFAFVTTSPLCLVWTDRMRRSQTGTSPAISLNVLYGYAGEPGMLICLPEKRWGRGPLLGRASPFSPTQFVDGVSLKCAYSAYLAEKGGKGSLHSRLRGGARSLALTVLRAKFPANSENTGKFRGIADPQPLLFSQVTHS